MKKNIKNVAVWAGVIVFAIVIGFVIPAKFAARAQTAVRSLVPKRINTYQIRYNVSYRKDDKSTPSDLPSPLEGNFLKAQRANGDMFEDSEKLHAVGAKSTNRTKSITMPSKGLWILTNSQNLNITTGGNGKPAEPGVLASPLGTSCEGLAGLTGESKTILGFTALHLGPVKMSENTDPSNGDVVSIGVEAWVVPEFDCNALEEVTTMKHNGVLVQTSTKTAISATTEAPADSEFEIRPGSVEAPPSAFFQSLGEVANPNAGDSYRKDAEVRSKNH